MVSFYPLSVFVNNRLERLQTKISKDIVDIIAYIASNIP